MKLKTFLLTGILASAALCAEAQEVKTATDSSTVSTLQQEMQDSVDENDLRLTHMYAGAYGIGTADAQTVKDGTMGTYGNMRAGGAAQWDLSDKLAARSVVALDLSSDGSAQQGKFLHTWWMQYNPTKGTTINVGKTPTAGTLMIGNPVTPGGHFLFTAESQVPFPGVGGRVDQKIGEGTLSAGGIVRPGGIEGSLYGSYGPFSGAVVLDPTTGKLNGGASYIADLTSGANIFSMVWLHPDALSYSVMFTTADKVGIFADGQRNLEDKDLYNVQVGALKGMNVGDVSAKLGVAGNVEGTQEHGVVLTIKSILFITLGGAK